MSRRHSDTIETPMTRPALLAAAALVASACAKPAATGDTAAPAAPAGYHDNTGRDDVLSGGVRMIPITTPKGTFKVWTKRVGNNPKIKILLLHGGPGFTHEYFEAADSYFPGAEVEYYYYDQLGSFYSDQPTDTSLVNLDRYVEEVEQVRQALHLDKDNFYLLGQSWGGLLGIEYALKYQQHLKGLIISNMMASIPAYVDYANKVLMPAMDPKVLAEVKALEAKQGLRQPAVHGAADPEPLSAPHPPAPTGSVARSGEPRLQARQSRRLRPNAGSERAGRKREAGEMGPLEGSGPDHSPDLGDRGPA